jgi:hypothetical protein
VHDDLPPKIPSPWVAACLHPEFEAIFCWNDVLKGGCNVLWAKVLPYLQLEQLVSSRAQNERPRKSHKRFSRQTDRYVQSMYSRYHVVSTPPHEVRRTRMGHLRSTTIGRGHGSQPNPNKTPNRSFHPLFTTNRAPPPYSSASHSRYRPSTELSGPSSNAKMSLGVT